MNVENATNAFFNAVVEEVMRRMQPNTANPLAVSNDPPFEPNVSPTGTMQPVSADPWAGQGQPATPVATPVATPQPTAQPNAAPQPNVAPVMVNPTPAVSNAWPQPGTYNVNGPNGAQQWQVGNPSAPNCEHGVPAAYVTGPTAKGGTFNAWRCALSMTSDWKSKCKLNKWA